MPEFNIEDFYRIYEQMIKIGQEHPFDCYLLLPKNNRIVRLVKKYDPFPEEKLKKFSALKRSGMFIKEKDKKIYFEFLK